MTVKAAPKKKAAEELLGLREAFERFSNETLRLEDAYRQLKTRFVSVNGQLDETSSQLQSILSHISQGLVFVDFNGFITTFNRAAEEILHCPAKKAFGTAFWDIFPDTLFGFSLREALSVRSVLATSFVSLKQEGADSIEIEVASSFVHDPPRLEGLILVIRDITEIRQLQKIANRTDRLKELGELAASVAHEIRNPLGGIEGFATLLKRDFTGQEPTCSMLQQIIDGARVINRLVSSVLHYARPVRMLPESIKMADLIRDCIRTLCIDAKLLTTEFVVKDDTAGAAILLDRALMQAAFYNLLVNAAQAMPRGGVVEVFLKQEDSFLRVDIHDSGVGISDENREKIFTLFFTTKENGHGFGLAEVHKTIRAHGGEIDFQSTPGDTTFTVKLPLKAFGGVSERNVY